MKTSLGLTLALVAWVFGIRATAQTTIPQITSGSVWKYFATGAAPGSPAWKGGGAFDDSGWPSGASPLGYGGDGEATVIPFGPNAANRFITTYFRQTINLTSTDGTFTLRYKRDDGIVIYINGVEIQREYLPAAPATISYSTLATVVPESEEPLWKTLSAPIPAGVLRTGSNVIAAEIHQASASSSDTRFDLELTQIIPASIRTILPRLTTRLTRGPYLQMPTSTSVASSTCSMSILWSTNIATYGRVICTSPTGVIKTSSWQPTQPLTYTTTTGTGTLHNVSVTMEGLSPDTPYSYTIEASLSSSGSSPIILQEGTDNFFRTAPVTGTANRPIRIWALGDFGRKTANPPPVPYTSGYNRQDSVRNAFNRYLTTNKIDSLDLWLWLGDNAYDWGTVQQYQELVFDKYDSKATPKQWIMKQTPIFATPGNHDYKNQSEDPTDPFTRESHKIHYYDVVDHFTRGSNSGVHSGKEEYYSFDYGNIHFVSLDSYGKECTYANGSYTCLPILDTTRDFSTSNPDLRGKPISGQVRWLEEDLKKAQQDTRIKWIIVITHYPFYSMGTKDSDTDSEIIQLREKGFLQFLEKFRVDLVMTGHSHVYERSKPVKGYYGKESAFNADSVRMLAPAAPHINASGWYSCASVSDTNSMIYFKKSTEPNYIVHVVNGSGGAFGGTQTNKWPHALMHRSHDLGGSMYLEINGNRLDAKFINEKSKVLDNFTIIKDSEGFRVPATDGTVHKPDCECIEASKPNDRKYTHYVRRNKSGPADVLLSIQKLGNKIGLVGDGTFNLALQGNPGASSISARYPVNYVMPTVPSNISGSWTVMNRYWTLTPTVELTGTRQVSVRHYYHENDYLALKALNNTLTQHNQLKVYKVNNGTTPYTINPTSGHTNIPRATSYNKTGAWVYDNANDESQGFGNYFILNGNDPPYLPNWITKWDEERSSFSIAGWRNRYISQGNHLSEVSVGRLNGGGGIGVYNSFVNPTGNQSTILTGDNWAYFAKGRAPGGDWKGVNPTAPFDDSEWEKERDGPDVVSPFGYSPDYQDGEKTRVPACAQEPCSIKWWTTYFRTGVLYNDVPSYYAYKSYIINYKRDDGIVIYINGKELVRDNMPAGTINYGTPAGTTPYVESEWRTIVIPNDGQFIKPGIVNIIAAEVHQAPDANGQSTSSDMHFDLEILRSPDDVPAGSRILSESPIVDEDTRITSYPNPTRTGKVYFTPALTYQSFQLSDLLGRVVKQHHQAGTLQELDLSAFPSGLYILNCQTSQGIVKFKIIHH